MADNNHHTTDKTRRKWPWIVLGSILLLLLVVRLALMTPPVHHWAKNIIVSKANKQLKPTLSVGQLSGDLWNGATLTDIKLSGDSTLATIDTLQIKYHPLSYFGDVFQIPEIHIIHPVVKVAQRQDSTFNVQHWMAASDTSSSTFAVSINDLSIKRGRVDVSLKTLPADSSFQINHFNLGAGIKYTGDTYALRLSRLDFKVTGTQISPVSVKSKALADEHSFSLQKLAIATAHSQLEAMGQANLTDTAGHVHFEARPLGWQDIAAYADSLPARRDMRLVLQIKGDEHNISMHLNANAEGIDNLKLEGTLRRDTSLVLTSAQVSARQLNLATFLSDTTMPNLQNLQAKADGEIPISNYQKGHLKGTISAANIHQSDYQLDALTGTFALQPSSAQLHLEPRKNGEKMTAEAHISQPWQTKPSITLTFIGRHINPDVWYPTEDHGMKGDLSFSGKVNGRGWTPQQSFWHYDLTVDQSLLMRQSVDHATFSGRFNQQTVTNQTLVKLKNSRLKLQAEVHQLQQVPTFSFELSSNKLNLANIEGLKPYPSSINAKIQGDGQGRSPSNLHMHASMRIDSSLFKGESIHNLSMVAQVADSMLAIRNGSLKSSIADGSFTAHLNPYDYYAPSNSMHFAVTLKDISSLAWLANVKTLQAQGTLNGDLRTAGQDSLIMNGALNLENVNYNQQFTSPKITGKAGLKIHHTVHYSADLHIAQPTIASKSMQDLALQTEGQKRDSLMTGSYQITLNGAKKGKITQAGDYRVSPDSVKAKIQQFKLFSMQGTLGLAQPYHVSYSHGKIRTDTLRLHSQDQGTTIALAVPAADSTRQKAYVDVHNLNLTDMQSVFLDQPYFQGVLNGQAKVDRTDSSLTASGKMMLTKLIYDAVKIDSVQLGAEVQNKRLTGHLKVQRNGKQIMEGEADIPFAPQKENHLDEAFLQQKVNAHLRVQPIALDEFSDVLKQLGFKHTKGQFRFDGNLNGRAGHPRLQADMSLKNASLSDVPIDSLTASLRYSHDKSRLKLKSKVVSKGQKIASLDALMPFKLDLKNLEVSLPGPQDSISVDLKADDYKLKTLNDFVSRKQFKKIDGLLNADIHIRGLRDNLQSTGTLSLQKAGFRVVQAGIRIDHINSTLQLRDNNIMLQNFKAKSGKGTFNAQGKIDFSNLVPGTVDMQATAKNFKIANTDKYNGIINLDMKLGGTGTHPKLSGNLDVISGFVKLDNFGAKSVENVQLDTTVLAEPNVSLYDSLAMDMNINLNKRFAIRNKRYLKMEVRLDGQVHLLKKPGNDLQLFGTLNTVGGYAEPLGKRFDLQKGSLAFDGEPSNPQLNIHTLYEPPQTDQQVKIYYTIEGTVEDPQFKYSSDPSMDLSGIISYTLFGQPYYKLNSSEQGVANSSSSDLVADFATQIIMNRLESLATGKLGIDVVKIDNTHVGGKSGTSITTGWYINPKVFFAIQNVITGSTPTTGFYLEYYLEKDLKLILSQGNDNQQGIDLQWDYDY